MSDIRKWIKIVESVPSVIADQEPKAVVIRKDATVMVDPRIGGGTARYMQKTPTGAMLDIKGIAKEVEDDNFSLPARDYNEPLEQGNDWFHSTDLEATLGTQNDKPEFRAGDMVKIADVYGTVIGPGFGVFIAYGTTGKDCIVSFDGKEILVPTANVGSVLEQDAKDKFGEMDNDGNLSPMSLGSENRVKEVTVTHKTQDAGMDNRDEFSKWMSTVEEAMTAEGKEEIAEDFPVNECGCGSWDCPVCFPDDEQEMSSPELGAEVAGIPGEEVCPHCGHPHEDGEDHGELEVYGLELEDGSAGGCATGGMAQVAMGEDDDAIAAFKANGGKTTVGKYHKPRKDEITFPGSGHIGGPGDPMKASRTGKAANTQGLPVVGMKKKKMEEEPMGFGQKGGSKDSVKLGDIVHKTEFRKVGGNDSPMTYGDENLDETPEGFDHEDNEEIINKIMNMQEMGLSKSDEMYTREELMMNPGHLQEIQQKVMGEVTEAKPTDTKTKVKHEFDDWDDILSPKQDNLPAEFDDGSDDDEVEPADEPASLPTASRDATRSAMANRNDSVGMRDMMNRINPDAGGDEPEFVEPQQPQNELTIRTARDVPAVISQAMQAAGMQSPEWHTINNLPGYGQRNIRGMGRSIFGMFTSTPLENIKTIANVDGQGPNSDAEINAVAAWLRDNAEDLGEVDVSHGMAIPGYRPDVKEYRANGIRFQVVRDPMGRYIYAYPDADARIQGPGQGQGQLPGGPAGRGNPPRLRESTKGTAMAMSLFEELKLDEEIKEAFRQLIESEELEESTLSKMIGKQQGGQNLVRLLHKKHKLGNEADLEPVKFNKDLLWSQFKSHPDDFVIVSGDRGVAGIKPSKKHFDDYVRAKQKKGETPNPGRNSSLQYEVIAFTDNGDQVDPELLRPQPEAGEEPEKRDPDPTVMRMRMGKNIGQDLQNANNTFRLLNDQIGPIRTVWISGFGGYRGDPESLKPATGSVERDKMKARDELGAGPDRKKAVKPMARTEAESKIFNKIRPILKPIVDKAYSKVSLALQDAVKEDHQGEIERLAAVRKAINEFKQAINTSGPIPMTNSIRGILVKALQQAVGAQSYTGEYEQGVSDLAQGSAAQFGPIVQAFRKALIGAIR